MALDGFGLSEPSRDDRQARAGAPCQRDPARTRLGAGGGHRGDRARAEVFAHADRGQLNTFGVGDLIEVLTRLGADILICVGEAVEGEQGAALVQGPDDE